MGFCGLVTSRILQIRGEVLFPAFKCLMTLGTKKNAKSSNKLSRRNFEFKYSEKRK